METIHLKVADGTEMLCYTARPKSREGDTALPGLMIFQEAFGVNSHIQSLVQRFADQGYVAIAPELFHRTAPPRFTAPYNDFSLVAPHYSAVTEETITQDASACFEWLTQAQKVRGVISIGYCMGGKASFIANAKLPLKAAVSYYGGGIAPTALHLVPLQKSNALYFWGGLDKHIPMEQVMTLNRALDEAKKIYTCVQISDADHGFSCDERPSYNPRATEQAWALTLKFMEQQLAQ